MVRSTIGRWLLGTRTARFVAAHPRPATALVLGLVMLAMGGSAAADGGFATTFGEGVTKTGP